MVSLISMKESKEFVLGIDTREIEDGVRTGIGRAVASLIEYIASNQPTIHCILFSSKPLQIKHHYFRNVILPEHSTVILDQFWLPIYLYKYKISIFFSPYYKIPLLAPCKSISTIFDLMYLTAPCYKSSLSWKSRMYYYTMGRYMAACAWKIVTCSYFSKKEIMHCYKVPAEKIFMEYLELDNLFTFDISKDEILQILNKFNIDSQYILYSGNYKPHKNVSTLLDAFLQIQTKFPHVKLVLAGNTGAHLNNLKESLQERQIDTKTVITGLISDLEMKTLYKNASCFVMPSTHEGFGFPPLEAMAMGVPVISSQEGSLPEVLGDAALYVKNNHAENYANAICKILTDTTLTEMLIKKGYEQAKLFAQGTYGERLFKLITSELL